MVTPLGTRFFTSFAFPPHCEHSLAIHFVLRQRSELAPLYPCLEHTEAKPPLALELDAASHSVLEVGYGVVGNRRFFRARFSLPLLRFWIFAHTAFFHWLV